jgi:hypothetical protein
VITRRGFLAAVGAVAALPIVAEKWTCSFCSGRVCTDGTCKLARVAKLPSRFDRYIFDDPVTWSKNGYEGADPVMAMHTVTARFDASGHCCGGRCRVVDVKPHFTS